MEIMGLKKFLVENKTNTIKNYSAMCQILGESKTTGLGKINQLERWNLYFEFVQQGHKFVIIKIFDDEIIENNIADYEINKIKKKAYAYSEYTEYLMPILLFLLSCEEHDEILMLQAELARDCGFFNEEIDGKSSYENYMGYREDLKEKYKDKLFFKNEMKGFTYHKFLGELKRDAYAKILTALKALKKLNVLEYSIVNVGLRDDSDEKKILSSKENEKYKACRDRAREKITDTYNEKYKKEETIVSEEDIRNHFEIQPLFYKTLNEIVKKNLDFNIVLEHIYITLLNNDYMEKLPNGVYDYKQYAEYVKKVNELVVNSVKKRIDQRIIKRIKFYVAEKIAALAVYGYTRGKDDDAIYYPPIEFKNLTYEDISKAKAEIKKRKPKKRPEDFTMLTQINEELEYYNKAEILNLLVSKEPDVETLDLNEVEKQYFESYCELENDMDEETKEMVEEVFKAFGVDK